MIAGGVVAVDVKKRTILSTGRCAGRSQYQEVNRENSREETLILSDHDRPLSTFISLSLLISSFPSKRFSVVYFQTLTSSQ